MKMACRVVALSALGYLCLGAFSPAFAQSDSNGPISVRKIDDSLVTAPLYGVTVNSPALPSGPPAKWLQVEFTFDCNTDRDLLPEVTFRVYIEVQDLANPKDQDGPAAVLTGETTFVNLPNARDLRGSFFVHPYTLRRFGGENAFSNFKSKRNIRVEALIDGQQIAFKDEHQDDANWVGTLKKIGNLVLPREMSPWILVNPDRYPPIKLRGGNNS